jgi:hypothetical protein
VVGVEGLVVVVERRKTLFLSSFVWVVVVVDLGF